MIIACEGVAAGTELAATVDVAVEMMAILLVIGVADDGYSVKVSIRASETRWPSDVVKIFSGFIQIVCDLTVQLRRSEVSMAS